MGRSSGTLESVPFDRVDPDDRAAVAASVELLRAARQVDDPAAPEMMVELVASELRYGWDLEPAARYLYRPADSDVPAGVLDLSISERDNRHLMYVEITVHPDHRRQGHGSVLMAEALRQARATGRSTVWVETAADDPGAQAFAERFGFRYASHDARRRQVLAEIDSAEVDRRFAEAQAAAVDYDLVRLRPPLADATLAELVEVTAAINDAPMGELTWEPEHVDVDRLRDHARRSGRQRRPALPGGRPPS